MSSDSDGSDSEPSLDRDLSLSTKHPGKRSWGVLEDSNTPPAESTSNCRVLRSRVLTANVGSSSEKKTSPLTPALAPAAPNSPPHTSSNFPVPFVSCLVEPVEDLVSPAHSSPRSSSTAVLRRAISIQELDDESWLSSPFISLVITRFAKHYSKVRYFSADFVGLPLNRAEYRHVTDILGRRFDFSDKTTPIIFLLNNNNIHWNLLRVVRDGKPELQLFEPLGLPLSRGNKVGLSLRSVPKVIVDWLDTCFPLPDGESWLSTGGSAITSAHQLTNYDCGVACLLYAEKCGQQETKEQINACTTQEHITEYREILKVFLARVQERSCSFDSY